MRLKNKVTLITGGTSGIGSATALRFAREGASVAITGRNPQRGEKVVQAITEAGGKAIFIKSDVRLAGDACGGGVSDGVAAVAGGVDGSVVRGGPGGADAVCAARGPDGREWCGHVYGAESFRWWLDV